LGPLKDSERQDLNCIVKEYSLISNYHLAAITFYEEVTDQNLDIWHDTPAFVPDALRHYYYQYLSSTSKSAKSINGSTTGSLNYSLSNQSGSINQCSRPFRRMIGSGSSVSTANSALKHEFSMTYEEICLDKLSIKELLVRKLL
jgi:hypothetical protein